MTDEPAPADIDELTSAMLTASRLLVAISARSLAAVEDRVTLAQVRMLVVLSTQGASKLVTLAGLLGVNPSTAMRMVDRLAAAGLIDRQVSPHSGREIRIDLTTAGRALLDDVTSRRAEIAQVIARMPVTERRALITALRASPRPAAKPRPPPRPRSAGPDTRPPPAPGRPRSTRTTGGCAARRLPASTTCLDRLRLLRRCRSAIRR